MSNKEIAKVFNEWASLLEIHDGSPFKVRTYQNAYVLIRRRPEDLIDLSFEELVAIPGLGKGLATAITQLSEDGKIDDLEELRAETPIGVRQMFKIRGLGAKKIKLLWKEYGFDNPGDLLQACQENRLIEIKGFGPKMQKTIQEGIEFLRASDGKYLMSDGHAIAEKIIDDLAAFDIPIFKSGDLLTWEPTIDRLELVTDAWLDELEEVGVLNIESVEGDELTCAVDSAQFYVICGVDDIPSYLQDEYDIQNVSSGRIQGDALFFQPPPELWGHPRASEIRVEDLIEHEDIKGVIHNHSTYSDGRASIKQMANACQKKGYQYLVMSDHSKSAFYANGLTEDRVLQQWREIDKLNSQNPEFKIYKSIESDILADGSLDYPDEVLEGFDLVIASVHAHLNMDEAKATERLLRAIEHPATRILGHPTGRLLLGRSGYPINHERIIDACAANNVSIEINANPNRLDLDWKYVDMAVSKGVWVSINPDAHSVEGIDDIFYGVMIARKGGLSKSMCLNALDRQAFEDWLS